MRQHSTPHTRLAAAGPPTRALAFARASRAALVACLCLLAAATQGRAEVRDPNTVKADMLCNMAKFVQWPDAIMTLHRGQIVVAVLGEDDLAATIANVLSSRSVNGKPVFVRFARRPQDVRGCHIVYIASSEMARAAEIEDVLKGTPTLTLADSVGFAMRGGMVNFAGNPPNLRFEICLARAQEAGLRISSRLLALANVVEPAN